VTFIAVLLFGIVIGWITYRTLARQTTTTVNDISAVVGAVGGAAVITFLGLNQKSAVAENISPYCIGLFLGFFGYLVAAMIAKKPLPYE
jgi:uncharacterized membrane protein YeaQ/YmgE (transglycosylase-associated protein family)